MEYDGTFEDNIKIAKIADKNTIIVGNDCGIYNIIFRKPLLNIESKMCGTVYIHAPNCTLNEDGEYIAHGTDESRTAIAYHQLCDLAKVPHNTNCYDLFAVLGKVLYPNEYESKPIRKNKNVKNCLFGKELNI